MDKKTEETVLKVADYSNQGTIILIKKLHYMFAAGVVAFVIHIILNASGLTQFEIYNNVASFSLGFAFSILILGVLFTNKHIVRITAFKMRLNNRCNKTYDI